MDGRSQQIELEKFVASLATGHDDLGARIRTVSHTVQSSNKNLTIHAHYLAFRGGQPTVGEFVDILYLKLVPFCLHRSQIERAQQNWQTIPPAKAHEVAVRLHLQALDLFKKANKNTNRNGEFGELITFLLIESVLKAPQFVAKMSLKTNTQMPVHGSDGIHLSFDARTGNLKLYWGGVQVLRRCEASNRYRSRFRGREPGTWEDGS